MPPPRLLVVGLVACVLACDATQPPPAGDPAPAPPATDDEELVPCPQAEQLDALLDRLATELSAQGIPGGAAAVACANGYVAAGGVGVTEAGGDVVVTGDTRFQIASITKTLTAATAVLLEEDGVLDRAAPLDARLPGFDTRGPYDESFTLAQLLAHTAGYPTEIEGGDFSLWDLAAFYEAHPDVALWSPPGRVWNYANYGYGLAGYAMQVAAGEPFGALLEARLFAPAGMDGARMSASVVADEGDFALGHSGTAQQPTKTTPHDSYYDAGWYAPMGGAWMGARDLARFATLLLADDGAFTALRDELPVKITRTDGAPDVLYGQGLFVDESGSAPVWSHGGGVEGFVSDLAIYPEAGVAVVVLINADYGFPQDTTEWTKTELGGVDAIYEWGDLVAADVVGAYQDDQVLGRVVITDDAGGLRADFETLGFVAELTPWDTDTAYFRYEPWDYEMTMTFWRDDSGAVDLLSTMAGVAARE